MNRRATLDSNDSMELLLDTVCNTFGAVIFISMLVAILVNRSSSAGPSTQAVVDPALESAQVQLEVETARDRVRVLAEQLRQQKLVRERFATDESLALSQQIQQQTESNVQLIGEQSSAIEQLTVTNSDRASLQHELNQQQLAFDAAKADNTTLRRELERAVNTLGRTARIPRVRRTTKDSVVYALDDGHLFRITTADQAIDDADTVRSLEHGTEVIRPRRSRGVAVPVPAKMHSGHSPEMHSRFKNLSPARHFVQLFVARDSFAAFLPVKDMLVGLGLEYEVIISDGDSVELFLGQKTRDSFVQ